MAPLPHTVLPTQEPDDIKTSYKLHRVPRISQCLLPAMLQSSDRLTGPSSGWRFTSHPELSLLGMRRTAKATLAGTSLGTTPIAGLAITLHAGTIHFSSFMREKKEPVSPYSPGNVDIKKQTISTDVELGIGGIYICHPRCCERDRRICYRVSSRLARAT